MMNRALYEAFQSIESKYRSTLGDAILSGKASKSAVKTLGLQCYLQEKWPSHIAHVYLGLDERGLADRELVNYILTIIRAENLGVGSKGVAHSELARRFLASLGVTGKSIQNAKPTNENQALMDWCDMSQLERPWIEALAVQIACESQVDVYAKIAKGLSRCYGVSREDNAFWLIHGGPIERKHARDGKELVLKHTSGKTKDGVMYAYQMSCRLLFEFFEAIEDGRK